MCPLKGASGFYKATCMPILQPGKRGGGVGWGGRG